MATNTDKHTQQKQANKHDTNSTNIIIITKNKIVKQKETHNQHTKQHTTKKQPINNKTSITAKKSIFEHKQQTNTQRH